MIWNVNTLRSNSQFVIIWKNNVKEGPVNAPYSLSVASAVSAHAPKSFGACESSSASAAGMQAPEWWDPSEAPAAPRHSPGRSGQVGYRLFEPTDRVWVPIVSGRAISEMSVRCREIARSTVTCSRFAYGNRLNTLAGLNGGLQWAMVVARLLVRWLAVFLMLPICRFR